MRNYHHADASTAIPLILLFLLLLHITHWCAGASWYVINHFTYWMCRRINCKWNRSEAPSRYSSELNGLLFNRHQLPDNECAPPVRLSVGEVFLKGEGQGHAAAISSIFIVWTSMSQAKQDHWREPASFHAFIYLFSYTPRQMRLYDAAINRTTMASTFL